MTASAQKDIMEKALLLPKRARLTLFHRLEKSLTEDEEKVSKKEWNEAWKTELIRRSEELKSGKVKAIPAAQVFAEMRKKYG